MFVILVQIYAPNSTKSMVPFFVIETKSPSMQGEGRGGGKCQQQHIEINISFSHKLKAILCSTRINFVA